MPDQATPLAFCPRCRRTDIRTVKRGEQEVYVLHNDRVGVLTCRNSGRPVAQPRVQR